jgi:hypothetical protein
LDGKVSGLSGRCPNIGFTVTGRSVAANSSTAYSAGKCADVKNGVEVLVDGVAQSDGAVTASSIVIEK